MANRCAMPGLLLLLLLLLLLSLLGCAATPPAAPGPAAEPVLPFDATHIGLITTPQLPCFSGRHLGAGEEVMVFEEGSEPVSTLVATGKPCAEEPEGRKVDDNLWHRTSLTGHGGAELVATLAVGVVANALVVLSDGGVDLDGDGAAELFASCTSSEGVHLTVWSGPIGSGTRLWHAYYYLGYDTEPTCSEAEVTP